MGTYLKPSEMNDLFTMKIIYCLTNDGGGEKTPQIIDKNKDKTPFGYPPIPPSMMWRADCFLVSKQTENKPSYPYGGMELY